MLRYCTPLVVLASLSCSCGNSSTSAAKMDELSQRVEQQGKELERIKSEINSLKSSQSFNDMMRNGEGVAYLTPGLQGYSVFRTEFGAVTVSLEDLKPSASGSRLILRFGNATNATLNHVEATVEWGSVDSKGAPDTDNTRSKKISFAKSLRAGAWTTEEVVLEGAAPRSLGFVRIRDLANKGIRLYR